MTPAELLARSRRFGPRFENRDLADLAEYIGRIEASLVERNAEVAKLRAKVETLESPAHTLADTIEALDTLIWAAERGGAAAAVEAARRMLADCREQVAEAEPEDDGSCSACHGSGGGDYPMACGYCSGRGYAKLPRHAEEPGW